MVCTDVLNNLVLPGLFPNHNFSITIKWLSLNIDPTITNPSEPFVPHLLPVAVADSRKPPSFWIWSVFNRALCIISGSQPHSQLPCNICGSLKNTPRGSSSQGHATDPRSASCAGDNGHRLTAKQFDRA